MRKLKVKKLIKKDIKYVIKLKKKIIKLINSVIEFIRDEIEGKSKKEEINNGLKRIIGKVKSMIMK